jgi:transposase
MSNILEVPQQQAIQALIAKDWSVRRIALTLGINRRTVKRYAAAAPKCTTEVIAGSGPPEDSKCTTEVIAGSGPPEDSKCTTQVIAGSRSLCEGLREVIEPMLELGLSAQRIYQDLVAAYGFRGSYPSVSRYVAKLKAREPERVWRMECEPGEEMQVDFGLGAPLVEPGGKTRRTWLFRAVLSYSRKGYSEVVLRQDTETFIRVIENAVRYFGGVARLLNFDNLKAAVIKADWYDPALNPKLADFCRHYGMTPMPCRSYTPQHKGKVERGVGYAKNNALKGLQFASLGKENAHLLHWEEHVADKRVHGTTRRQVAAMFEEERRSLRPLPAAVYESYQEGRRRVQRDSFVEVAAHPELRITRVPMTAAPVHLPPPADEAAGTRAYRSLREFMATREPTSQISQTFVFRKSILLVEPGRLQLILTTPPMIAVNPTTLECDIIGWDVSMPAREAEYCVTSFRSREVAGKANWLVNPARARRTTDHGSAGMTWKKAEGASSGTGQTIRSAAATMVAAGSHEPGARDSLRWIS